MEILTDQLCHHYMKNTSFESVALDHVSVHIPAGRTTAIIGRTGSGKSTLAQHFNGLLLPTSGALKIGNEKIGPKTKKKILKSLRRQVGMVFQYPEHQLFEETVEKDVLFGPINLGKNKQRVRKTLPHLLEQLGLSTELLYRSPFDLSGGQMRRVAILGVLLMEPRLLILDEPTAGLDPLGQQQMLKVFKEWQKETQATIVLITHQMEEVAHLADKVIVMEKGRVVMEGEPKEIYRNEQHLLDLDLDLPESLKALKRLEALYGVTLSSYHLSPQEAADELQSLLHRRKGQHENKTRKSNN